MNDLKKRLRQMAIVCKSRVPLEAIDWIEVLESDVMEAEMYVQELEETLTLYEDYHREMSI